MMLEETKMKNDIIAKKLITVFGKFEEYLTSENGGRGVMKAEHINLNSKYEDSLEAITDPKVGLLRKLQDM